MSTITELVSIDLLYIDGFPDYVLQQQDSDEDPPPPEPTTDADEWLIRARRRGRR